MGDFDRIVQAFVGPVIGARDQCLDRLDVATQLVGNDHARLAEPSYL